MSKTKSFRLTLFAMMVLFGLLSFAGQASIKKTAEKSGPDRIVIQLEKDLRKHEMPAVDFLHDRHTNAMGQKCDVCHVQEGDEIVFRFKRTQKQASMALYHVECVACHADKKAADEPAGPLTAECRSCHVRKKISGSSWEEIRFDKSLHYIHESASGITGIIAGEKDNCSRCHHQYNDKTEEIFFTRGREEACIYCHKTQGADGIRSIREASHDTCVKCHQLFKTKKQTAGPVTCAGCHDAGMQAQVKRVDNIPRLKRNQPDVAVMTGWETGSKTKNTYMDAVAFNHEFHESKTRNCQICHHQTLKKCSDCHSVDGGNVNGGFVSLEKAMHAQNTSRSCIGCHKKTTMSKDCAGCHVMLSQPVADSESCKTCHSLPPEKLESMTPEAAGREALKRLDTRYKIVPVDKIPETVVIGVLSNEYHPSRFPHRKVVRAIIAKVETSEMAKSFHGDQAGVCMGCHHNSPKTLEPVKCVSCHSVNGPGPDDRPGLKGAYHGQCMTCHQEMAVDSVPATDCVKCHEAKR